MGLFLGQVDECPLTSQRPSAFKISLQATAQAMLALLHELRENWIGLGYKCPFLFLIILIK